MKIDKESCTACGQCTPYCPVGAISLSSNKNHAHVNQDECVECGVCLRSGICPTDSFFQPDLDWPRSLRAVFSNPIIVHPETGVAGRGTDEAKNNDVTGRFRRGEAGFGIELGRPGIGTRFSDINKVTQKLADMGIHFEPLNPITALMTDKQKGKLPKEIFNEKVLTAIVEFKVKLNLIPEVLQTLKQVASEINTVLSLDLITRVEADGEIPTEKIVKNLGYRLSPNGKVCLGLGKPRFPDS